MWQDFRTFIARGNVLDLAVGVIIGAAFGAITKSLTEDVIMPAISALFGGLDLSGHFILLGAVPASYKGSLTDYAALKAAHVPLLGYGAFLTAIINFLILAWVVFLLVRSVNKMMRTKIADAADPEEVVLLREIRDTLKGQSR
jgi:large conductance mechanosensitive channel